MGKSETEGVKKDINEILSSYIKNKNGAIFCVLEHGTKPHIAILRSKNNYYEKPIREIKQGLVDGTWSSINEHEYRKWVKEDNAYITKLLGKLLKRIILAQLLIELDDELIDYHDNDKYFRNILEKSNKQAERIVNKHYDSLYSIERDMLVNFMNQIDDFTKNAATVGIEGFVEFNKVFEMYKSNPDQFDLKNFEFTKQL